MKSLNDTLYCAKIISKLEAAYEIYAVEHGLKNNIGAKYNVLKNYAPNLVDRNTFSNAMSPSTCDTCAKAFTVYLYYGKALGLNLNKLFSDESNSNEDIRIDKFTPDEDEILNDPGYFNSYTGWIGNHHLSSPNRYYKFNLEIKKNGPTTEAILRLSLLDSTIRTFHGVPTLLKGGHCIYIKLTTPVYPSYHMFLEYIPHIDGRLLIRNAIAVVDYDVPTVVPCIITNNQLNIAFSDEEIKGLLTLGSRTIHIPVDHLNDELSQIIEEWKNAGIELELQPVYELKQIKQAELIPSETDVEYNSESLINYHKLLRLRSKSTEYENLSERHGFNGNGFTQRLLKHLWSNSKKN